MRVITFTHADNTTEQFDLTALLDGPPEEAKKRIVAGCLKLLQQKRLPHDTYIAVDQAATPRECLLHIFRYMLHGTHDLDEIKRRAAAKEEALLAERQQDEADMEARRKEDLKDMQAEADAQDLSALDGDWQSRL